MAAATCAVLSPRLRERSPGAAVAASVVQGVIGGSFSHYQLHFRRLWRFLPFRLHLVHRSGREHLLCQPLGFRQLRLRRGDLSWNHLGRSLLRGNDRLSHRRLRLLSGRWMLRCGLRCRRRHRRDDRSGCRHRGDTTLSTALQSLRAREFTIIRCFEAALGGRNNDSFNQ